MSDTYVHAESAQWLAQNALTKWDNGRVQDTSTLYFLANYQNLWVLQVLQQCEDTYLQCPGYRIINCTFELISIWCQMYSSTHNHSTYTYLAHSITALLTPSVYTLLSLLWLNEQNAWSYIMWYGNWSICAETMCSTHWKHAAAEI